MLPRPASRRHTAHFRQPRRGKVWLFLRPIVHGQYDPESHSKVSFPRIETRARRECKYSGLCRTVHIRATTVTMTQQHIAALALVVRDYDEAIDFYVEKLGFELIEDLPLEDGKRWVLIKPPGKNQTMLLLARAKNASEEAAIGNQTGGRVFLFLQTDDFWRDFRKLEQRGVTFIRPPATEVYGTVSVFIDLYGNQWDLIQPARDPINS